MAVSLGVPYRFNQLNLLSKKTLRPRPLERAVVRVHDFARLLIIAPRPRVAANRDDAPAVEARAQGLFVLHELRPVARRKEDRIPGEAKAVVAFGERTLFLLEPELDHVESLQPPQTPVPLVEVENAKRTRLDGLVDAIRRGAQRLRGFVRRQRWRSDPEAALVLAQSRDNTAPSPRQARCGCDKSGRRASRKGRAQFPAGRNA